MHQTLIYDIEYTKNERKKTHIKQKKYFFLKNMHFKILCVDHKMFHRS